MNKQNKPSSPAPVHRLVGRIKYVRHKYGFHDDTEFLMYGDTESPVFIFNKIRYREAIGYTRQICEEYITAGKWVEINPSNVRDHRAGPSDQGKADQTIVAGSGASTCWAGQETPNTKTLGENS
jgi:hypothetical protein